MFKRIRHNLYSRVSPTGEHLSGLRTELRSRLESLCRHRTASDSVALENDFSKVLAAWGIAEQTDIPDVIRALRLRYAVFLAPVLVCLAAALALRDFASCLALVLVSLPCLLGIVTTAWRVWVLEKRRFLPLARWLFAVWKRP